MIMTSLNVIYIKPLFQRFPAIYGCLQEILLIWFEWGADAFSSLFILDIAS